MKTTMKRICAAAALAFAAVLPSYAADRTLSENWTLTSDETIDGVLTVPSGVTVDLNHYDLSVKGLAGDGTITSTAVCPMDLTSPDTSGTHVTWSTKNDANNPTLDGSTVACNLFNDNYTRQQNSTHRILVAVSKLPLSVVYDFGEGVAEKVDSYYMHVGPDYGSRGPRTWTFEGSNDNSIWTPLDSRDSVTWPNTKTKRLYTVANPAPYRYYRIVFTASSDSSYLELVQLEYLDSASKLSVDVAQGDSVVKSTVAIAGNVQIVKSGEGEFAMANAGTYTAGAVLSEGTLALAGDGAIDWSKFTFGTDAGKPVTLAVGEDATLASGGDMNIAIIDGGASTLFAGEGGTVNCSGTMRIGYAPGSTGTVEVAGGNLTVNGNLGIGADGSTAILRIDGGDVSCGVSIYVGNGSSLWGSLELNGGRIVASSASYPYRPGSGGNGRIIFNGGTIAAPRATTTLISADLPVIVNAGGGTIDNGGFDLTCPASFSGEGAMTFAGGGTFTLGGTAGWTGGTVLTNMTVLSVSSAADVANVITNGLSVAVPAGGIAVGTVVMTLAGEGAIDPAWIGANDVFTGAAADIGGLCYGLSFDGKSVIVKMNGGAQYVWAGASGDEWGGTGKWNDGTGTATWEDGNIAVFDTANAVATLAADASADEVVFRADATVAAGGGTLTAFNVAVSNGVTAAVDAPTAGELVKTGAGTLVLSQDRTDAPTTLAEGTLALSGTASLDWSKFTFGTDAAKPVALEVGANATISGAASSWLVDNGANITSAFYKAGGDWPLIGNIVLGNAAGASSSFYHEGGTLSLYQLQLANSVGSSAYFEISGGTVTSEESVLFNAGSASSSGTLVLKSGGVLSAPRMYSNKDGTANFNIDGGTLVTTSDVANNRLFSKQAGGGPVTVTVGANGGVIDNGGNVNSPSIYLTITGEGGLTFTGAGRTRVYANQAYLGATTISNGTTLAVSGTGVSFAGPVAFAAGSALDIASFGTATAAITAPSFSFGNGVNIPVPTTIAAGRYKIFTLSEGEFASGAADNLSFGCAYPYTVEVEGDTIYFVLERSYVMLENISGSLSLSGSTEIVGAGGFDISTLSIAAGKTLTFDPVATPVFVYGTSKNSFTFGSGAKFALSSKYADMTLGRVVLVTYRASYTTGLPSNLDDVFDANSIAPGATYKVVSEAVRDANPYRRQLVLYVGDYENEAKEIRILPVGDSITQGVAAKSGATADYWPQYRSTIAARLAACGYKPKMLGVWTRANCDASHVLLPDDWAWHCGIGSERIVAGGGRGGVRDNMHVYLDIAGDVNAITFLIGTNDIGSGGKTGEETYEAFTNLVFATAAQRPDAKIFGSTILDRGDNVAAKAQIVAFNELLKADYAAGRLPANFVLADLYEAVPLAESGNFLSDNLHLNWKGCLAAGEAFAGAIKAALPLTGEGAISGAPDATLTDEPQTALGAAETVPAAYRDGMTHVFTIDAGPMNVFSSAPYTTTNNAISVNREVSRMGYYMELVRKGTNRRRFVWVDFDASGKTLDRMEFPWDGDNLQAVATSLHVYSNDPHVHNVAADDDTVQGIVEGTRHDYAGVDAIPSAPGDIPAGAYGWNDTLGSGGAGYACFQIHRILSESEAEVLFAWNGWGAGMADTADEIGIGTFTKSTTLGGSYSADYTFMKDTTDGAMEKLSADAYQVRRFEVWAVPVVPENPVHGKWIGGAGANMSTPGNWEDGVTPVADDALDFSGIAAAATINCDIDATFGAVTMGSGVVTFTGSLAATSFSDTSKVAVGANSTVTIDGDLELGGSASEYVCDTVASGGRFVVTGHIVMMPEKGNYVIPSKSSCAGVIAAKGLVKNKEGGVNFGRAFKLAPDGCHVNWEIGEDGISGFNMFYIDGAAGTSAKIVATANFTLSVGIANLGALELDTAGRTVVLGGSLGGGIQGTGTTTISGAGRAVANYDVANLTSIDANKAQSFNVSASATLALNAGSNIGTGTLAVPSGATLALPQTGAVALGGALGLDGASMLQFCINRESCSSLAVPSLALNATTENKVLIEFTNDSRKVPGGEYTLVSGAGLSEGDEAKFALPEGDGGSLTIVEGNLVYTAPTYFYIKIVENDSSELAVPLQWIYDNTSATPAGSAAEVAEALAKSGENGLPAWQSYCLGLDPKDAQSVVLCAPAPNQPSGGKIGIAAGNLNIPEGLSGVKVTAYLDSSTDGVGWNNDAEGKVVESGKVVFEPSVGSGLNFFA